MHPSKGRLIFALWFELVHLLRITCLTCAVSAATGTTRLFFATKDMGKKMIHMQKPIFKAMEALTLRRIGPHFLLYATEDIDVQYGR